MATPGAAKPPRPPKRHRGQRALFGGLGVVWVVIGLIVGFGVGRWVIAMLLFGLAVAEGALWLMARRT
jgi:uncharacterized membrane protein